MLKGTELEVAHKISLASRNIEMAQTAIDSAGQFLQELVEGLTKTQTGNGDHRSTPQQEHIIDRSSKDYQNGYRAGLRAKKKETVPEEASASDPSATTQPLKLQAIDPRRGYGDKGRLYPWLIRSYIQANNRLAPEDVVRFAAQHGYLAELASVKVAVSNLLGRKQLKILGRGVYAAGPKFKKVRAI